jgi:hypothetical protein
MGSRSSCYASFMESRSALGIDGIVLKELTNNHWGGGKSGGPQIWVFFVLHRPFRRPSSV